MTTASLNLSAREIEDLKQPELREREMDDSSETALGKPLPFS